MEGIKKISAGKALLLLLIVRVCIPVAVHARVIDDGIKNRRVGGVHEICDEQLPNISRVCFVLVKKLQ